MKLLWRRIAAAGLWVTLLAVTGQAAAGENPAGRTKTGEIGDVLEYALPLTVLASSVVVKDNEGTRQLLYGAATTLAVTHGLKALISKERPDGRDDDGFPSSHTAITMHAAAHVHERYGLRAAAPAYLVAAFVGYSRVHDERHDEEDVLAGAVIGYLSARLFSRARDRVSVTALPLEDGVALNVSLRF